MKNTATTQVEVGRNYIHAQSVRHEEDGAWYTEYDQYGRITFSRDRWGYWSMRFYNKPLYPDAIGPDMQPYDSVHKWWHLYHAYRDTAVYSAPKEALEND